MRNRAGGGRRRRKGEGGKKKREKRKEKKEEGEREKEKKEKEMEKEKEKGKEREKKVGRLPAPIAASGRAWRQAAERHGMRRWQGKRGRVRSAEKEKMGTTNGIRCWNGERSWEGIGFRDN